MTKGRFTAKSANSAHTLLASGEVCRVSIRTRKRQAQAKAAQERKKRSARKAHPVLHALALPEDAAGGCVRVMLLGSGQALVENLLGVVNVGGEEIRLSTREGILTFYGEGLLLCDVRSGALTVRGCIERIELPHEHREEVLRHD